MSLDLCVVFFTKSSNDRLLFTIRYVILTVICTRWFMMSEANKNVVRVESFDVSVHTSLIVAYSTTDCDTLQFYSKLLISL